MTDQLKIERLQVPEDPTLISRSAKGSQPRQGVDLARASSIQIKKVLKHFVIFNEYLKDAWLRQGVHSFRNPLSTEEKNYFRWNKKGLSCGSPASGLGSSVGPSAPVAVVQIGRTEK